jgi:hypothetical protein
MLYGKYAIIATRHSAGAKLLLVDTVSGTVTNLGSMALPWIGLSLGTQRNNKIYIGNNYTSAPGYVYVLTLDTKYVMTLSVSNPTPAPGQTIQLTAVLKDSSGNPVSGAEVEFYVVSSVVEDRAYGSLIGTALTDATGTAKISYTIPSTAKAGDVFWFRAIFKG